MNARKKYIAELATHLGPLSQADRDDALEFYDEYIADAQLSTVAAIEDKLGTAKQLSHQILADYSIKSNEKSVANGHPASPHANWRVFWWVVLAIVSSPLLFGVGIAALVLLITVAAVVFGLVVGLLGCFIGLVVSAGATLYTGLSVLGSQPYVGLFYAGLGLSLIGLFLICLPLLYWIIRWLSQQVANLAKFLYRKLQERRK